MDDTTTLAGRYRLGPLIGTGGTADVFRATDLADGSAVAVKVLRTTTSLGAARHRFANEARLTVGLRHPGIVRVLDADVADDGRPFLVMELVEGRTLADRLATGPLASQEARRIGLALADALAYAHDRGVVHRDVKPGNVLLARDGRVLLADFGIARTADATQTATGQVVGSPAYIAPEQVAAEAVGPEADVYSLGLVLFEALTGRRAFEGTAVEVAYARLHSAPAVPVSLGGLWVGAIGAMTARRPDDRPGAAGIARLLADPPELDPVATASIAGAPSARRWVHVPWSWLGTGAAAVLLVGLMLLAPRAGDGGAPPAGAATMALPRTGAAMTPVPVVATATEHHRVVHAAPRQRTHHARHARHAHGHHGHHGKGRGH